MSRYQIDTDVLSRCFKVDENHLWGRELRMVNRSATADCSAEYCGKLIELTYPARSSIHYHKEKTETFIVLNGVVTIQLGNAMRDYGVGEQVTIYPGQKHSFMIARKNNGRKALILEVSTHHEDEDTYRVEPSVNLPGATKATTRAVYDKCITGGLE